MNYKKLMGLVTSNHCRAGITKKEIQNVYLLSEVCGILEKNQPMNEKHKFDHYANLVPVYLACGNLLLCGVASRERLFQQ